MVITAAYMCSNSDQMVNVVFASADFGAGEFALAANVRKADPSLRS
jgi:hypothetical protein